MEKKLMNKPEIELIELVGEDIITTSGDPVTVTRTHKQDNEKANYGIGGFAS